MKALTVLQPYAALIIMPQSKLPPGEVRKRVENRTWPTRYRGPLLIHAGKSLKFMRPGDERFGELVFGAIVGVADLVECVEFQRLKDSRLDWLYDHPHAEGPWCWVLENVVPFDKPVPYAGRQGLFDVACEVCVTGPGLEPPSAFLALGENAITDIIADNNTELRAV